MARDRIFISSSADVKHAREQIAANLDEWLSTKGHAEITTTYRWEEDTIDGKLLKQRCGIQAQLLDTIDDDVTLTICLFGERCGLPLPDKLEDGWADRLEDWHAEDGKPGMLHPWPNKLREQKAALQRGCFPLTGTVFELISAVEKETDADNLVIGFVAADDIHPTTELEQIDFNARQLWKGLTEGKTNKRDRNLVDREIYRPQVQALLNFIKFATSRGVWLLRYPDIGELTQGLLGRAKRILRAHYKIPVGQNPFKNTLDHWTIDDDLRLPGRDRLIRDALRAVRADHSSLVVLKGRSGCGKSSVLQRGVLADLEGEGFYSVVFRPGDIEPLFAGEDRSDMVWDRLVEKLGCGNPEVNRPRVRRNRHFSRADNLSNWLKVSERKLVIGIDQFEELLDEYNLSIVRNEKNNPWQHVISFLAELAKIPEVRLVVTLESSREATFERLDIGRRLGLTRKDIGVDVTADEILKIARLGFFSAGLTLGDSLLEEIRKKWEAFEAGNERDGVVASPLPLACLWFADLFEKFEERAGLGLNDGIRDKVNAASTPDRSTITLEDLGDDGVAFEGMVQRLAEQAYVAAGETIPQGEWDETNQSFRTLDSFLTPLIGIDNEGHKRLLTVGERGIGNAQQRLRRQFRRFKLLTPMARQENASSEAGAAGSPTRLRLVHQAIIDQWPPARAWFAHREEYLRIENEFRLEVELFAARGKDVPGQSANLIRKAARILSAHGGSGDDMRSWTPGTQRLFNQAISVFSRASTPNARLEGGIRKTYAHIAAEFHLVDLLEDFIQRSPKCLHNLTRDGRSLIERAAWSRGPAVRLLIDRGAPMPRNEHTWHPIAAAIQHGGYENYQAIIPHLPHVDDPIGEHSASSLHYAAHEGKINIIRDLISRGASLLKKCGQNLVPVHYSSMNGQLDAFILLHGEMNELNHEDGNLLLRLAAARGHANILRHVINDEDSDLEAWLQQTGDEALSPIMEAAANAQFGTLAVLLQVCDLQSDAHVTHLGDTLLHLVMQGSDRGGSPTDDYKSRVTRCVRLLLQDGRIDPTQKNARGRTAFDLGRSYFDARMLIRQDERFTDSYADMSPDMRIHDLSSRKADVVLKLVRNTPEALVDLHNDETGLDILVRLQRGNILATILSDSLIGIEDLRPYLARLIQLSAEASESALRHALAKFLTACRKKEVRALSMLLDIALTRSEDRIVKDLKKSRPRTVIGPSALHASIFHTLASQANIDRFRELAQQHKLALPRDAWGRKPSQHAPSALAAQFEQIEEDFFKGTGISALADEPESTKFHQLAKDGDIKAFKHRAKRANIVLPLDQHGRRPSEVAPAKKRRSFERWEQELFK